MPAVAAAHPEGVVKAQGCDRVARLPPQRRRIMNKRSLVMASLALAGVLATGAAQARPDGSWPVGIHAPGISVGVGTPVYGSRYYAPPVYVQPAPVYYYGAPRYVSPARWDADRDGIPNRYDRVYNPRWDRDGDGVPNRYDRHNHRHDRRHYDRDGDGVPNWQDRHPGRGGR